MFFPVEEEKQSNCVSEGFPYYKNYKLSYDVTFEESGFSDSSD